MSMPINFQTRSIWEWRLTVGEVDGEPVVVAMRLGGDTLGSQALRTSGGQRSELSASAITLTAYGWLNSPNMWSRKMPLEVFQRSVSSVAPEPY